MEVIACSKCGQSYLNEVGLGRCPLCQLNLEAKIQDSWFARDLDEVSDLQVSKSNGRREVWELTVIERLKRLLKKIPAGIQMNEEVVESVSQIPIAEREEFIDDLRTLLNRLEHHYAWWDRVRQELDKPVILRNASNVSGTNQD